MNSPAINEHGLAMSNAPYDPRSVANLILDSAEQDNENNSLGNLALQKLLYFAHALYLVRHQGKPLMTGYFEAWKYGPVHPAVYYAFKGAGAERINFRAKSINVMTGEQHDIAPIEDRDVKFTIQQILMAYSHLSPGRLVEISHAPKGPWHEVWNKAKTSIALGMRISDDVTISNFKYLKIPIGHKSPHGEICEEQPFT